MQRLPDGETAHFPERAVQLLHHSHLLFEIFIRALFLVNLAVTAGLDNLQRHELLRLAQRIEKAGVLFEKPPQQIGRENPEQCFNGIACRILGDPIPQSEPDIRFEHTRTQRCNTQQKRPEKQGEKASHEAREGLGERYQEFRVL